MGSYKVSRFNFDPGGKKRKNWKNISHDSESGSEAFDWLDLSAPGTVLGKISFSCYVEDHVEKGRGFAKLILSIVDYSEDGTLTFTDFSELIDAFGYKLAADKVFNPYVKSKDLHLNVYPGKEESTFLRSLGWDGNAGEDDGLTEEEINAFYDEYMKTKPLLELGKEVEQKFESLCGSHTTGSSGAYSKLSLHSGVFWETERKKKLKPEVLCYIDSSPLQKCNKNASCYSDIDLVAKSLKGDDTIVSEMGLRSGKFVMSICLRFSGNCMMPILEKRSFNRSSLSYSNISLGRKNLKGKKVVVLRISRKGSGSCLHLMVVLVPEWINFVLEQFWEDKNEQRILFQFPFDPGGYEHPIETKREKAKRRTCMCRLGL